MLKKILWLTVFCFSFNPLGFAQENFDREKVINREKRFHFIFEGAAGDIANNIPLWLELEREADGCFYTGWTIALGDKIPSQPVAVIEVLSFLAEDTVPKVCPRAFFEGSEIYEMEDWMKRAITSLDAFTMKDAKKEKIRQRCRELIQTSLDNKDSWWGAGL